MAGFSIYNRVLREMPTMKAADKILFLTLFNMANNTKYPGQCWPTVRVLCKTCNISRATFFNSRFILESAGFIDVEGDPHEEHYHVNGRRRVIWDRNLYTIREQFIEETPAHVLNEYVIFANQHRKAVKCARNVTKIKAHQVSKMILDQGSKMALAQVSKMAHKVV
ncbi:MAG: helix-turn-helix domain-containing protein [Spirochaetes bacterium]|nr:helix-turn-helix domain-containing protein [Spirochaetota bacterium]